MTGDWELDKLNILRSCESVKVITHPPTNLSNWKRGRSLIRYSHEQTELFLHQSTMLLASRPCNTLGQKSANKYIQ